MSTHNLRIGAHGEQCATDYLMSHGYDIIERNWRCPAGEVDIVAKQPGGPVCLIEVKTRTTLAYGHPAESITRTKLARMRQVAGFWRRTHGGPHPLRLDLICITLDEDEPDIWHLAGVDR